MHHGVHTVLRLIALREHALPALHLRRHTVVLKKLDDVAVVKGAQRAVEKFAVAVDVFDNFRHVRRIRDVAAALARDAHLTPRLLHFLQQRDVCTVLGRLDGRHHAARPRTDDNYLHLFLTHAPTSILTR